VIASDVFSTDKKEAKAAADSIPYKDEIETG
jgi:hypothetical protein